MRKSLIESIEIRENKGIMRDNEGRLGTMKDNEGRGGAEGETRGNKGRLSKDNERRLGTMKEDKGKRNCFSIYITFFKKEKA